MSQFNKPIASLDSYFASKRFVERLNTIRRTIRDPDELKARAFAITMKLNLKLEHVGVINKYLMTGIYSGEVKRPSLRISNKAELMRVYKENDFDIDENGVFIEIPEDVTQEDIVAMIAQDWQKIRAVLDKSYPDRRKKFAETRLIDNYLTIADELNGITDPHERARKAADLAVRYHISSSATVYKIAKEYKEF